MKIEWRKIEERERERLVVVVLVAFSHLFAAVCLF